MFRKLDVLFLISIAGLIIISLFFIYSSSVDIHGHMTNNEFYKQFIFVMIGLFLFVALHLIPLKFFFEYRILFYGMGLFLLIITLFFGSVKNGAKSWLGIFGVGIQPSEFMKIAVIIYLSALLADKKPNLNMYRNIFLYACPVIAPMILILLQPDMGTMLVYIPILLGIYLIYGVSVYRIVFIIGLGFVTVLTLIVSYYINSFDFINADDLVLLHSRKFVLYVVVLVAILILALIGVQTNYFKNIFKTLAYIMSIMSSGSVLAFIATIVLKPYQMQRLLVFVNPEIDPLGSGWHILQSMAAIGAGGIAGQGYLQGSQAKLEYLPQKSTDFIFSMIGEEVGFLGSSVVIILYLILIWRIILIGTKSDSLFSALFCSGVVSMFFTHFMVNVGMTIGIMPITGIPLLLLSYGGSSLLTSLVCLSIVHNIYFNNFYKKSNVQVMV